MANVLGLECLGVDPVRWQFVAQPCPAPEIFRLVLSLRFFAQRLFCDTIPHFGYVHGTRHLWLPWSDNGGVADWAGATHTLNVSGGYSWTCGPLEELRCYIAPSHRDAHWENARVAPALTLRSGHSKPAYRAPSLRTKGRGVPNPAKTSPPESRPNPQ